MATEIHPTAVIDPKAEIGQDVVIGPYVVVEAHTKIGDRTRLEPFSLIKKHTSMGADNHVYPHATIGGEPQDLSFKDEETFVEMGDGNVIRECVTIHRGTAHGSGVTKLGSHCMLMAYAHIAHDCTVSDNVIMANTVNLAGHVQVGRNVIISGTAAVQQFVRIGDYAFLGGASGYNLDVPPYMLAHGVRGKLFGPNLIGLRRNGFSSETCSALKKAYKTIFRSGMMKEDSLPKVLAEFPDVPEVATLAEFIRTAKRGVTPDSHNSKRHDD